MKLRVGLIGIAAGLNDQWAIAIVAIGILAYSCSSHG